MLLLFLLSRLRVYDFSLLVNGPASASSLLVLGFLSVDVVICDDVVGCCCWLLLLVVVAVVVVVVVVVDVVVVVHVAAGALVLVEVCFLAFAANPSFLLLLFKFPPMVLFFVLAA